VPLILDKSSFTEKKKLKNWKIKNTNSHFTKEIIEKSWKTKINYVHQPAINLEEFSIAKKEKVILNVGRFFKQLHSKRQDVLVDFFKEMTEKFPIKTKDWKLVLAGRIEDQKYFEEIKKKAKGLNIEFKTDLERAELLKLYSRASIYWHATGYEVNQDQHPEKVEHFGISTIEAMASGAVPVVINKGGQKEVLGESLADLLWDSKEEALIRTIDLINDQKKLKKLSKEVVERSQNFSKDKFKKILLEMIEA
jgi:glycosyltransferase involved in cell wall biosynthesis